MFPFGSPITCKPFLTDHPQSHIERYADILPFEEDFLTWVATQEQEQDPESIRIYWNVKTLYDLLEPVERSIMYLSRTLTRLKQIGRLAIPMKQARMSPEEDNLIMAGTLKKQFEMGTEVFETYDHAESLRIINMQNGILNERLRDADQAVLSQFRTSDSTGQGIMILEIWRNITRQDAPRTFEAQYQVAEAKKLITLMHLDVTERLLGHFPRALASTLKLKKMFEAV